jgi:hypothetical protein
MVYEGSADDFFYNVRYHILIVWTVCFVCNCNKLKNTFIQRREFALLNDISSK